MRKEAGIDTVEIERTSTSLKVIVITSKPGTVLGQDGVNLKELEKSVSKIVRNKAIKITIEVTEVKNADMSDVLLAGYVPPFTAETFTTACKNQQASSPPMN